MSITSLKCKIEILCSVNPSEDSNKIKSAILNIFPTCDLKIEKFSIRGESSEVTSLEKIQEVIHSMNSQRIYKRVLEKNSNNNSSWFYLNKQAAFAKKIAICENSDESPLGPIKIIFSSPNIDRIIEWLIL